jgi:hypothetical protein
MTKREEMHPVFGHPLAALFQPRDSVSRRASSFDRSGGNADYVVVNPGETHALLEHEGPGCVTRLYCAFILPDLRDFRAAILRCYWDGSSAPSVEVPLGDFFGLAHARVRTFSSHLVAVNAGIGSSHGLNAYFPMPFSSSARITIENRGSTALGGDRGALWYHVEYETYSTPLRDGVDRFHACYRQEHPTKAVGPIQNVTLHAELNDTGDDNYVVLDTEGAGRMAGLVLEIENVQGAKWYGEGDDMVFVDGESWPPAIHGTGTEEIFGGGACPSEEYAAMYSGFHLIESAGYDGLVGMYRWYTPDPIHFSRSLRWTIEHGHANNFANNYSSVAYWYQSPLAALPELPSNEELAPPLNDDYERAHAAIRTAQARLPELAEPGSPRKLLQLCEAAEPLYRGGFAEARARVERLVEEPDWSSKS